jgi:hypothetical protein
MKRKRLTRLEAIRLYDDEGKTFDEIGRMYEVTRQAAHHAYHYQPVPDDQKRKPGPKGGVA